MMSQTNEQTAPAIGVMTMRQLLRISMIGVIVGATSWGVTQLLGTFTSLALASAIANILAACIGMAALVKLQAYRPLLVVLAASFSLWGLVVLVHTWPWQSALLASVLLYAATYGLFAWVARIRRSVVVAISVIVLILVVRVLLAA